jgi:hypothetical protein
MRIDRVVVKRASVLYVLTIDTIDTIQDYDSTSQRDDVVIDEYRTTFAFEERLLHRVPECSDNLNAPTIVISPSCRVVTVLIFVIFS